MPPKQKTPTQILATVSGNDQPGITTKITGALSAHNVRLIDITQAVIQNLLSLSIAFEIPPNEMHATLASLLKTTQELGLKLETSPLTATQSDLTKQGRYALTLIGEPISAGALHEVTRTLAQNAFNLDSIKRLSHNRFQCLEIHASSASSLSKEAEHKLRRELLSISQVQGTDIALQREGLFRKSKRLVVMDMDSTLIQAEVIDEIAREKGVYEKVSAITHAAMQGKMDFNESLKLRVQELEGTPTSSLEKVYARIPLTPGAEDLIRALKRLGYKIALISGGFTFVADRLKDRLGIDYAYANTLEVRDGKLTGNVIPPIVNAQRKADLLDALAQQERIVLDQVIAIGDGANDLPMLDKAGLGIAFNAKPSVSEQADLSFNQKNMGSILYLLGFSSEDIDQLLA